MYAINTIMRIVNFASRSLVGLAVGFALGVLFSHGYDFGGIIQSFHL